MEFIITLIFFRYLSLSPFHFHLLNKETKQNTRVAAARSKSGKSQDAQHFTTMKSTKINEAPKYKTQSGMFVQNYS